MAASVIVKTICDTTIVINDGTAVTPLTYTVVLEPGNLSFSQPRFTYSDIMDRCSFAGSRKSGFEAGSISFSVHAVAFTGTAESHLTDMIDGRGSYSARVSTDAGAFDGKVLECVITIGGAALGDNADNVVTFPKVRFEWDFAEGTPDVINVTGTILAAGTFAGGDGS